jgi:hypothetical protein
MKTTILVEKTTRDELKRLGTKGQSYDNLINWLIRNKLRQKIERHSSDRDTNLLEKKESLDNEFLGRISSEPQ